MIRHGVLFYLIAIVLLLIWNALQLALATSILITEANGPRVELHRGDVLAWTLSGSVMQVVYVRDDIFADGFQ